jgi:hypothetical protein
MMTAPATDDGTAYPGGDSPQSRGLRVLVVEDDADSAAGLAHFLGGIGHQVEVAPDGQAAVEAAQAVRPDVVLLDIGLPGLDGWEVARRLGFPLTAPAPEPEVSPCGCPAGAPWLTLNGPVAGTSPLVLAGEVFVHIARLGFVASGLWASLACRSSERVCRCSLLLGAG